MEIKVTTVVPEICECGRLYKDRMSHLGKMMCSACYTGLSVEDLKKLWDSTIPVRFLDPGQAKMYDSEGKEVLCSCGKPAGSAIIGKNASKAMCSECMYGK